MISRRSLLAFAAAMLLPTQPKWISLPGSWMKRPGTKFISASTIPPVLMGDRIYWITAPQTINWAELSNLNSFEPTHVD